MSISGGAGASANSGTGSGIAEKARNVGVSAAAVEETKSSGATGTSASKLVPPVWDAKDVPRGVVASLLYPHYPHWFDPASKSFVWGAPPVDNIGKLRLPSSRN